MYPVSGISWLASKTKLFAIEVRAMLLCRSLDGGIAEEVMVSYCSIIYLNVTFELMCKLLVTLNLLAK